MKTIGIFYGSTMGNTQSVAESIAAKLGIEKSNLKEVSSISPNELINYDVLFLGSSTWGDGDLQDDWDGNFINQFAQLNLSGKEVAVFGAGDSSSYSDTFCDAIGIIAEAAEKAGAKIVGQGVDVSDYSFDTSKAIKNGAFCGLPIDADNEDNKTEQRVSRWVEQLKVECGL